MQILTVRSVLGLEDMHMEEFWEAFLTTGKVTDYLKYKGTMAKEQTKRVEQATRHLYPSGNCEFAGEWPTKKEESNE